MAPPLIQLQRHQADLRRHAAAGGRRTVGLDRRARLPGRPQRLRQVDAAEDRRRPDRAGWRHAASCSRAPPSATCRRSRIFPASRPRWPMSRPASTPGDDRIGRAICSNSSGSPATRDPAHVSGGEARRAALARVLAPSPDILLLDEPTNHLDLPAIEWLEERAGQPPLRAGDHQPRPALPVQPVALHRVARPRQDPADRPRLRAVRGLARRGARGRRARPAQARPQDRRRGALAALRRHRAAASATSERLGNLHALRDQRRDYRGATGNVKLAAAEGEQVRQARDRGQGHQPRPLASERSSTISRPASCAATASASSARTAPARPRWSSC